MGARRSSPVPRAAIALALWVCSAPCWGIGVDKPGPSTTVSFQPVVWEPYIPELYVEPVAGAEGAPKAALTWVKPDGELPGIHQAWKNLKQRYRFDDLGDRNEATSGDILSGWKRSETGFLVHASSQITQSGDATLVEQLIPEAPALAYVAVGIDFGDKKLAADKEAYLLDKYFKAMKLKVSAHEIEWSGPEFKLEDIRRASRPEPFLVLFDYATEFNRPWKDIMGSLTTVGAMDRELSPWRSPKHVEMQVELETEGRLNDSEEAVRKTIRGAARFIVVQPKSVDIRILNREEQRKQ